MNPTNALDFSPVRSTPHRSPRRPQACLRRCHGRRYPSRELGPAVCASATRCHGTASVCALPLENLSPYSSRQQRGWNDGALRQSSGTRDVISRVGVATRELATDSSRPLKGAMSIARTAEAAYRGGQTNDVRRTDGLSIGLGVRALGRRRPIVEGSAHRGHCHPLRHPGIRRAIESGTPSSRPHVSGSAPG